MVWDSSGAIRAGGFLSVSMGSHPRDSLHRRPTAGAGCHGRSLGTSSPNRAMSLTQGGSWAPTETLMG